MNALLFGTIILLIEVPGIVYIGVDSKVISIASGPTNVLPMPKIHQTGDVVFAHAGIFKDTQAKLDVVATANSSIEAGGDLKQTVDRFTIAIETQLSAALPDIRAENSLYFKEKLKRPLEMLFASARSGAPQTIVVFSNLLTLQR